MSKKTIFDQIDVAAPCSQNWNEMRGNEAVRFCQHCDKNVHDISEITRKQAKKLIASSNGDLCIRYTRRPDGRVKTAERKLYQISERASRLAAGVFGAAVAFTGATATPAQNTPVMGKIAIHQTQNIKDKTESGFGSISGAIKDPNGAAVPSLAVNLQNTLSGEIQTSVADDKGFFEFKIVPIGLYQISVDAQLDFAKSVSKDITVVSDKNTKADIALETNQEIMLAGTVAMLLPSQNSLIGAAFEANLERVKELLQTGADPNSKEESDGTTALHAAVENGSVEIVRELLQAGAEPNARITTSRRTPLMSLDGDATPELVQLLLTYGAQINSTDNENAGILLNAVRNYAEPAILKLLIQNGVEIDAADDGGMTALIAAASDDNLEAVKLLLDAGANPNLKNVSEETALSQTDSEEIRKILIVYGAINEDKTEHLEYQPEAERPDDY